MKLWYLEPAKKWVEALPLGNGRLGAMVFGGVQRERLALNEDSLWSGHPGDDLFPNSFEHLQAARRLIDEDKPGEAQKEIEEHLLGPFFENYEPLGDLWLDFPLIDEASARDYHRELNLLEGVARVSYRVGDTHYLRECFVSSPDQTLCLRMAADKGGIDVDLHFDSLLRHSLEIVNGALVARVRCPSRSLPSYQSTSLGAVTYDDAPEKQGISATAIVSVSGDGEMTAEANHMSVRGASNMLITVVCRSNFEGFDRCPGLSRIDATALAQADAAALALYSQDELIARHTSDFASLMARQSIVLDSESMDDLPTDERLRWHSAGARDDGMPLLLYQFGRYLMVSGSRQGTKALNLQGIWNEALQPPWSSNYTTNINLEMNYWSAEICNLSPLHEPLFDLIDALTVTGEKVAREMFHARGSVVFHNTDLWAHATPVGNHGKNTANYAWWPMAYGWLAEHLFERFIYTGDLHFLKTRALPVLRNAARFYIDTATRGADGYRTLRPATSPENRYWRDGQKLGVAGGATMSDTIIREVLSQYLCAVDALGLEEIDVLPARKLLGDLPPLSVGADGCLLEWDKEYEEAEPQHRHLSHLTGLFPGHSIRAGSDGVIDSAVKKTLERRGDDGTGWSLGWKVNLWARLGDGDHALRLLDRQLRLVETNETNMSNGGGTYQNMFCAHPPFQIDGNFAAASGVPRLLIDSDLNEITLLPALPSAWKNLTAHGLRAANGYTVDLAIEDGRLSHVRLTSGSNRPTKVRLYDREITLSLDRGQTVLNPASLMPKR